MKVRKLLDWRKVFIYSHRWLGIAVKLSSVRMPSAASSDYAADCESSHAERARERSNLAPRRELLTRRGLFA
jgi:hypothetical protein